MPTRTFAADRSSLVALTGSQELGGGQDDHLPIGGPWNGYTFRGLVRFVHDFAGVKRINSANLYMRTTSQVHVGFSSTPDILVRRATSSWSPNSSGESWGTSPVVYPGPSTTTTNQYTKRMPTSEGTDTVVNITGMVRDWAPVAAGGKGAANYGLVLLGSASGDISEVYSFEASSGRPYIVIDYDSDAPPVATPTGPTGTVTTVRPTITGTGSDPDDDAITSYDIEVRQGATVRYSATAGSGTSLSHVPTADLPAGALTVRLRATAAGVVGAWSADRAFTVDRVPLMGAWSAPAASVAGTRRPVHTVAWSDPDGDAGEVYDLQVWTAPAGAAAVYSATNQATGLGASSISHTPTADLPGGALQARVRVRTRGVWSAWSTWRAYTVVLTVPTLSWEIPAVDGGWAGPPYSMWADPTLPLAQVQFRGPQVTFAAPSGTTLASGRIKMEVVDAGIGGPVAGTVILDTTISVAGGAYNLTFRPSTYAASWIAGTVRVTFTITAANSGQTIEARQFRFALGDWAGAVALGDQVAALAAAETTKGDAVAVMYRAQSSPTAAAPGAIWRVGALSTVQGELPATNAYLGVWLRLFRQVEDPDAIVNGDFETGLLAPWNATGGASINADANSPAGPSILGVTGDGVTNNPGVFQRFPVVAGATYRASCYARSAGNGATARLLIATRNASGGFVNASALALSTVLTGWTLLEGHVTIPADGSVATVDFFLRMNGVSVPADSVRFDGAQFRGMLPGDAGMDRLALNWQSLG